MSGEADVTVQGRVRRPPAPALAATDLDGTLLHTDGSASLRTVAALEMARERGVPHVIVTGRPLARLASVLTSLQFRGIAVCLHGRQIWDTRSDVLVSDAQLDRASAKLTVRRIAAELGPVQLAVDTCGRAGRFIAEEGFGRGGQGPAASGEVDTERLWDEPIQKVVICRPGCPDDVLYAAAVRHCLPGVSVEHGMAGSVELLPGGVDKAAGVAAAARLLGVRREQVVAFGDMPTDVSMLRWSGWAVAMANAHPAVLAVADEVAPANDDDGVAVVLERLLVGR